MKTVFGPYISEEYRDQWGRPSAAKRGYGHQWRKKREEIIERDGKVCAKCGKKVKKVEVDHRTPKSRKGTDAPSNLRVLCGDCHRKKTAQYDKRDGRVGYSSKGKYAIDNGEIVPIEDTSDE